MKTLENTLNQLDLKDLQYLLELKKAAINFEQLKTREFNQAKEILSEHNINFDNGNNLIMTLDEILSSPVFEEMIDEMYSEILNELKEMNFQSENELYEFLKDQKNHVYKQVVNANIKITMMDHYLTVKTFNDPDDIEFLENFNINDYDIEYFDMLTIFYDCTFC